MRIKSGYRDLYSTLKIHTGLKLSFSLHQKSERVKDQNCNALGEYHNYKGCSSSAADMETLIYNKITLFSSECPKIAYAPIYHISEKLQTFTSNSLLMTE